MRIAISQREESIGASGHTHDCLGQDWYHLLSKHEIKPIPNIDHYRDFDFDVLILSSGNDSAARLKTETAYYQYALENDLPILGTCHGAEFLAKIAGASFEQVEGHKGTEHVVKMDGRNVIVNSYHESAITSINEDEWEIIAKDTDGNIEGFKHKDRKIWGIMWHPEKQEVPILPEEVDKMLEVQIAFFSQSLDWMDAI